MTTGRCDDLPCALRARGQRVTPQRLAIAAVLQDLSHHATAEEIHGLVGERVPGISLPTVYATLDLMEDLGLVRRVATDGGRALFDARTDEHHHAVCRRCGSVLDIEATPDHAALLRAARSAGFAPDDAQVVVRGVCADCRAAADASGAVGVHAGA
jgi:Fe2+ or Zn2+ uptake regulation protein